jgi:tRNA (5-methylaminomethyl-2-thiouridylate)-methyltransferase
MRAAAPRRAAVAGARAALCGRLSASRPCIISVTPTAAVPRAQREQPPARPASVQADGITGSPAGALDTHDSPLPPLPEGLRRKESEALPPVELDGRRTRIAVAMSGGVDSSLVAHMLVEKGFDVVGVYARSWENDETHGEREDQGMRRCDETDFEDAKRVAAQVGPVELVEVDLVRDYWSDVFQPYLDQVSAGHMGNPDVTCNRHVKLGALLRFALGPDVGADFLATGHYAQLDFADGSAPKLVAAADPKKDQSYALCQTESDKLERAVFPLGAWTKDEVRQAAKDAGLITADKRESMGICMVGKRRSYKEFMDQFITPRPGPIVTVNGTLLGEHRGIPFYTIGERARVSGLPSPVFTCFKNAATNTLVTCAGRDHDALRRRVVRLSGVRWVAGSPPAQLVSGGDGMQLHLRDRHLQPLRSGLVKAVSDDASVVDVFFPEPQIALCDGQVGALYDDGNACLGGGTLEFVDSDLHRTEWELSSGHTLASVDIDPASKWVMTDSGLKLREDLLRRALKKMPKRPKRASQWLARRRDSKQRDSRS